jgi:hypothetical protein
MGGCKEGQGQAEEEAGRPSEEGERRKRQDAAPAPARWSEEER